MGKKRCIFGTIILLLSVVFITACGHSPKVAGEDSAKVAYEVIDDEGTVVKMPAKPQRIMTTHFYLDTMILGIVPPERMVAISKTAFDPSVSYMVQEAAPIHNRIEEVSLETIIALKPDLIIARDGTGEERIQSYRELGIPVFIIKIPSTIQEIEIRINTLAQAVGEPQSGNKVIAQMQRQLEEIETKLQSLQLNKKSCILVSKMNHSYGGKGCMFDNLCKYANVRNAVAEIGIENGQIISKEILVQANPDFFLLSQSWEIKHGNEMAYQDEFFVDPALNHLQAVKNNQVIYVLDKYIYSTNQNCVWAIKKIANAAYGEIFDLQDEHFIKGY